MMLVMEVVTTALLLVAIAAAQKPTTIDESSVNTKHLVRQEDSRFLHRSVVLAKILPDNQTKEIHEDISLKENLNSEVALSSNEYIEGIDNSNKERMKRKVIFGGGSYGHGGRRTSATGGDPYGRRRGHYGPDNGPHESWPYRQADIPYVDTPMHGTSGSYGSQSGGVSMPVYSIVRPSPTNSGFHSSSSSSDTYDRQSSSIGNGRKTKTGVHETPKTKLAKDLKWEIAKYAVQHGTRQAVIKFEDIVGRKLPLRKVEKFIKRYQKQQQKNTGYNH